MSFKTKLVTLAGCAVSSLLLSVGNDVAAQDAYLARIYGDGVHQYFRHDTNTAKCRFDSVINEGSRDPRAYYFRAIIALEAGDTGTAESDIRTGARYELEGRGTYDVWSALARVQGPHRVKFECYRNSALLSLRKQSVTDRYPLNFSSDPEKLRGPVDPYRTDLEPNVNSIYGNDPFLNEDEPPSAPLQLEDDDDDTAMEEPADDDFSDDDFSDAMDETPEPEVDSDEPFDDGGLDDEDPFGDTGGLDDAPPEELPSETAPDDLDPFGDDAADDLGGDDPFGGDADVIDEAPGDAAPGDDPFADDAGEDPFGDIFE